MRWKSHCRSEKSRRFVRWNGNGEELEEKWKRANGRRDARIKIEP